MRTGMRVGVCGLLIWSASTAYAADRGFYFGASGGQASYDFEQPPPFALIIPPAGAVPVFTPGPTTPVLITPLNPAIIVGAVFVEAQPLMWLPEDDDQGTAWNVTAGYRINRYLAVEAGYVNLGTLSDTQTIDFPPGFGIASLNFHRELETAGPSLTVFGTLPLSANWQLYGRAGMLFADTDLTTKISGNSVSSSFDSDATTLGAGAQYDWGGHWSARLEYQRTLDVGGDDVASAADVDSISLGFLYRL
jgi:opacity protein-like surface antigen